MIVYWERVNRLSVDLQKAGLWKRIAAWLLDAILISVLAVGFGLGLSALLDYDGYSQTLESAYTNYENQYGVSFDIDQKTYEAMTAQEKAVFDKAYQAFTEDEQAIKAYNMLISLSLLITTIGILLAVLVLEFIVPLLLGNGATVGKKVFSLGLIRTDGVKINTMQLFVRALLGKFTIETMIPLYLFLMMLWGLMGIAGTVLICGLGITQMLLYGFTRTNSLLHDLLAGTVVVDISSQRVFASTDDLIEYTKRVHAEKAERQDY